MNKLPDSIPAQLRDLLKKLEFLSMIQKDQKPCINDMSFVGSYSWFGSIKRRLNSEGHKSLVLNIESIIDQSIVFIRDYADTVYQPLILDSLERAKDGIQMLIHTYRLYPNTVSSLRVCIANIDLQLNYSHQGITVEDD